MKLFFTLALALLLSVNQDDPIVLGGDWEGSIFVNNQGKTTELPLVLKLRVDKERNIKATLDSPSQGELNIKFDEVSYENNVLKLVMNQYGATFQGQLVKRQLVGTWNQSGQNFELKFTKILRSGKS